MKKKLFVLGGNHGQMEIIQKAKSLGYYVISSDLHPDAPGHRYSDEYVCVDVTDGEAVLSEARRLQIDGIVPYQSDALSSASAYVAEQLGLPGNPTAAVETVRNKNLFRDFLAKHGFATPRHSKATSVEEACRFLDSLGAAAIMKPTDCSGSRGVHRVSTASEVHDCWDDAVGFSSNGEVIIEEFIEKKGLQCDGDCFLYNGEVIFHGIFDQRSRTDILPHAFNSVAYPSSCPMEVQEEVRRQLQRLMTLLGMRTGPFNVEFIVGQDDRIYFLDMGVRNGGACIPYLLEHSGAFDETAYTVMAAVGDRLPPLIYNKVKHVVYYRQYILQDGIFDGLDIAPTLEGHILRNIMFVEPGTPVRRSRIFSDVICEMCLSFDSDAEMQSAMDDIDRLVAVRYC